MDSMAASMRSPGFSQVLDALPTPAAVPVEIMSPGSRVMICEMNSMTAATGKIC